MEEKELNIKNKLVQQLFKTPHGKLDDYVDLFSIASGDKDLFAHYIAWNNLNSKITDSKCALPVIALRTLSRNDQEYGENAIASLMLLNPRELCKAYQFSKRLSECGTTISGGWRRRLQEAMQKYLSIRESSVGWWDKAVVRNRKAMLALYAVSHYKPSERSQKILFEKQYPKNSVFQVIKDLKNMTPLESCGQILKYNLPMSVVIGSGVKIKDNRDVLLAMVSNMTGNELLNSSVMLKNLGAFNFPEVLSAYDNSIEKAKTDKRVNIFKASKAIEKVDNKIAKKLVSIQNEKEKEIKNIDANVLILGDCSGSMENAIEVTKKIASVISNKVSGNKYLVFFSNSPRLFDITDKTSQQIYDLTKNIRAHGMTSIGCGLEYITDKKLDVDVIIIVSDGGDNTEPLFNKAYKNYCNKMNIEPLVYFFNVKGNSTDSLSIYCKKSGIIIEKYEIDKTFDYYSLPNILSTIKKNRYDLLNQILSTPLLKLSDCFNMAEPIINI